jgi:hypothetical protein
MRDLLGTFADVEMKIFISFATPDDKKRKKLARGLEGASPPFEAIVVATRRDPGRPLAEKVAAAIRECDCLVPILTPASVPTQWLNQEIGFATALGKHIVALVDKDVAAQLKGFVHNQLDLPFQFTVGGAANRSKSTRFAAACEFLVEYLDSQRRKVMTSTISPNRVKAGDSYTTTVNFKGTVLNGFFDNRVVHLESDFRAWNWDPSTLPIRGSARGALTGGILNGPMDLAGHTYTHHTSIGSTGKVWPTGRYKIYVRLYSHIKEGEKGRQVVAENEHDFEVV